METTSISIEKIKQILTPELPRLKKKFHISYLGIFGSYARSEQQPDSDVDILVDFDPNHYPGFLELIALEDELSEVVGKRVDLVTKSSLRKRIGKQILDEATSL